MLYLDRDQTIPSGAVFVVTTAPVPAGGEFFLNYGDKYWDSQPGIGWVRRLAIDFA